MQVECLIRANAFGELEVLARNLPDGSPYLEVRNQGFISLTE